MKKKVNDILKGVAGAGVALGGAAAFGEADVLYTYAAEETSTESDSVLGQQASETVGDTLLDTYAEKELTAEEKAISEYESASESIATSTAGSLALAQDQIVAGEEAYSAAEQEYNSANEEFMATEAYKGTLEALRVQIKAAKEAVEVAKQYDLENNGGRATTGENGYFKKADQLANLLIQYRFAQEGYVGNIEYSEWESGNYATNNVKVVYGENADKIAYFDYVTADAANEWLAGSGSSTSGDNYDINKIDHIIVVKKTPVFTYTEYFLGFIPTGSSDLTYSVDRNGNITGYTVDGKAVDASKVTRTLNGNSESFTYNGDTYTLSGFTGDNNGKGVNYFSEAEYDANEDPYSNSKEREELTSAENKLESVSASLSTLVSDTASLSISNSIAASEVYLLIILRTA